MIKKLNEMQAEINALKKKQLCFILDNTQAFIIEREINALVKLRNSLIEKIQQERANKRIDEVLFPYLKK